MNNKLFKISIAVVALLFLIFFVYIVIPPLIKDPNIMGAFAAGFVNPFSSGYSADVIACGTILSIWIIYEYPKVKYGWVCILLSIVPGVAIGFALYLILRTNQLENLKR